jgi:transcriptional regulator with XRE-family HTH domain
MKADVKRINPKSWRKMKGKTREVFRQMEWFRLEVDELCSELGLRSGIASELSAGIGKTPGFISLLRKGDRLPDFETATAIALHFGMTLAGFLEEGRSRSYKG